jgi:uncharacterized protein YcbK (DUF882 family)
MEELMHYHKDRNGTFDKKLSRRQLLKLGVFASILNCASPALASLRYKRYKLPWYKKLSLYNIHTGESIKTVYWSEGEYITEALYDINFIMRDHRTNAMIPIDPRLLDLLHDIFVELDTKQPFHIISGYRTVKTNNLLRKYSYGVAKNSLHISGKAVDIRVPQKRLSEVRQVAMVQKSGGVGYYPQSNFVHIDVGTIRYW